MKANCFAFLIEAEAQLKNRLPEYRSIFKGLTELAPQKVLNQMNRVMFSNLPFLHLIPNEKFALVESQYRMIRQVIWVEEELFSGSIPENTEEFWCKIFSYKNSHDEFPFYDLALYALSALTVPISNATVERIFSHVTAVKSKLRNRMNLQMLDSIVRIRTNLAFQDKCCTKFQVTAKMLELFSSDMYVSKTTEENSEEILLDLLQ
jgi:hypothetical protein